jgi:hypothetical protein
MNHLHQTGVYCTLLLLALRTYSAPIAISQITSDITSTDAVFSFDGSGTADNIMQSINSYIRLETDEITPQENTSDGFGTLSNSITGTSALAEANGMSILNNTETDRFPGAANSTSMTTVYSYYNVENVNTVSFSSDMETDVHLITESSDEYAYAYVEQSLGLYRFENNQFMLLDEFHYFDEQGVTDGESYDATGSSVLNLYYDFGDTPFTGQMFIEGIAMAYTDVQGQTTTVPEPGIPGLLLLGIVGIVWKRKRCG